MRRRSILALSLSIAAGSVFTPLFDAPSVYAADSNTKTISKDEAVALANKYAPIPADYTLDHHNLEKEYLEHSTSAWVLHFSKERAGGIHFTIDAQSGKLLSFSRYQENPLESSGSVVDRAQAEQTAQQFLQKTVDQQERDKLSLANEYENNLTHFGMAGVHSFMYTRVEGEIPFPENFIHISIDQAGNVIQFSRRWHLGTLPSANPAVSLQQAQQKLADEAKPSLTYVRLSDRVGDHSPGVKPYSLVYQYGANDGMMVDASKGSVLNPLGQPLSADSKIQPLGDTKIQAPATKRINRDEAQSIAEEFLKRIPGTYTTDGSSGSGTSIGSDGISRHSWSFGYVSTDEKDQNKESIRLEIDDTGQVSGFSNDEVRWMGQNQKVDNPIAWDQAKNNAIDTIKLLFPDRLGELYLVSQKPSDDVLKKQFESGTGGYSISFGWLKDNIPVENAFLQVEVNAETGKIMHLWSRANQSESSNLDTLKPTIDANRAKQIEAEKQKVMLTYFQPSFNGLYMPFSAPETTKPNLVYRPVGEAGVVDAVKGEWVSFRTLRESQQPQDINQHPSKTAILFAIQHNILKTENGQVNPSKVVTRGELVAMMLPMAQQLPISAKMHRYADETSRQSYTFTDVSEKSSVYPAVQQALRIGLIPKEGNQFHPNAEVSRVEVAEMIAKLVGYDKLLTKHDIFKTSYLDVDPRHVPAVALSQALDLWKGTETEFKPNQKVTRAEVAEILYQIAQTFKL
ncbi:hypothetical protein BEP19_02520 [Ammoniphilus oxalaticus]|uniref:SLH domain-containing protein n=1 Tax=Ammoniphilus oxalaticus TaxID=66863 RepID=A0A419SNN1_9BACL|nr:S-layer homology domain-containing protein [Ammoniphilus oxalaticus]RKD25829.1 hypothetical protein BEP19_02520 [Ammoniphilus oxalaticus]